MKADMSALKEQMASMMDAMLGMKQLMESNMAIAAAVSSAAEADPTLSNTPPFPASVTHNPTTTFLFTDPNYFIKCIAVRR